MIETGGTSEEMRPVCPHPRRPEWLRLIYPGGGATDVQVADAMDGIFWGSRALVQLSARGIRGTLNAPEATRFVKADPDCYFWTLEPAAGSEDRYPKPSPNVPVEVLVYYPKDPQYADADHPDGDAKVTINVLKGNVQGLVWSSATLEQIAGHGIPVNCIPDPPDYVTINSRAPGCTILNGVVVCYA